MAVTGKTNGLVSEVMDKLEALSKRLGKDVEVTSGKRQGNVDASAHNSGIAADVKVAGLKSIALADELVTQGFSGVGEYYKDDQGTEDTFAHGDLRGQAGSENSGAYAPGGGKSNPACWYRPGPEGTRNEIGRKSGHTCPK